MSGSSRKRKRGRAGAARTPKASVAPARRPLIPASRASDLMLKGSVAFGASIFSIAFVATLVTFDWSTFFPAMRLPTVSIDGGPAERLTPGIHYAGTVASSSHDWPDALELDSAGHHIRLTNLQDIRSLPLPLPARLDVSYDDHDRLIAKPL